jgi:diacylglycerol kinase (CTP)
MTDTNTKTHRVQVPVANHYKKRSDVHWERKIWHISTVFFMAVAWMVLPFWVSMTLLILGWIAFVPVDFVRLNNPELNAHVSRWLRLIMRQSELDKLAGTTYLLTGIIVVASIFPKSIVSLSLLYLAFADPIASYVGIRWGRDKIFGHKSVQGFVAAFVVCFLITWSFLYFNNVVDYLLVIALLGGLVGALAELIPIAQIDDNFTMPLLSSGGLYFIFQLFNVSQMIS